MKAEMSYGLVNLTLPLVVQEIEDVLDEYPEHPYQLAFAMPELHRKLIAHVLSQVPNRHIVADIQDSDTKVHHSSLLQERLRLEVIIRGSMLHLLRENADWLHRNLPQP